MILARNRSANSGGLAQLRAASPHLTTVRDQRGRFPAYGCAPRLKSPCRAMGSASACGSERPRSLATCVAQVTDFGDHALLARVGLDVLAVRAETESEPDISDALTAWAWPPPPKKRLNRSSQANGALMRVSPLGIFGVSRSPMELTAWARTDASLTHRTRSAKNRTWSSRQRSLSRFGLAGRRNAFTITP
jgi:hypothetical protein